jgi:hypothetical protein
MVKRVDRMKDILGQVRHRDRTSAWPHRIFVSESRAGGCAGEAALQSNTSGMSLARRLEQDPRLAARAANWLFIKGGIVVLLMLGLIVLGLSATFR